ncbi:MAG: hypothetical protein RLO50_15380 [Azospirillaceae bacterium]
MEKTAPGFRRLLLAAVAALALAACAGGPPYPLNMTQAEWDAYTPAEQEALRQEARRLRYEQRQAEIEWVQAVERRRDRLCAYGVDIYC